MSLTWKLFVAHARLQKVRLGLTALAMIAYIAPLTTITAVAADLGAGPAARAWILSSTSVGLAAGLLATGVLGDRIGRRPGAELDVEVGEDPEACHARGDV